MYLLHFFIVIVISTMIPKTILPSSIAVMNTLRYREHISLPDLYTLILSAPQFKAHLQATNRSTNSTTTGVGMSGVIMDGLPSRNVHSFMHQNLELLRSVLMEGSSKYIIQEDRRNWNDTIRRLSLLFIIYYYYLLVMNLL